MAQITKIADRKYFVRISKGSGKSRTQISRTIRGTREDAKKWANKQETALDLGGCNLVINLKTSEFLEDWLENVLSKKVRKVTLSSYKAQLRTYAIDTIGRIPLLDLKAVHIQKIYSSMERSGMSPRTIEYVHAIIRSALNYAVKQEMIASNPASRCDLPKKIRKEKEVLTLDQAKKFIENSRQVKNGIICEFMLLTGLRPSECLGLKWADVDFVNSTVSIVRGVTHRTDGTGGFDFHPTKTKRSNRKLPLSPNLVNILKRHKRTQNEQIIASGGGYSRLDLVFATDIGTPLRQRNVRTRVFDKILTNTGIDGKLSPYSLRHSFATLMLTNNENLKVIQEYLGHSSIAITADTYSHVTSMMKKEASDNLQALLGNSI